MVKSMNIRCGGDLCEQFAEGRRLEAEIAELRDTLLPKLMSGEMRVGTIENQIEAVA
jgi:hypothetical protein